VVLVRKDTLEFFDNKSKHVVAQSVFGISQLIKIDGEGLDLQVIKGATSVLGKTEVIFIDAAVTNPSFDNSALAVMNAMDGYGYKQFDITDLNRPFDNRTLWLVELMFVLKGGKLDNRNGQRDNYFHLSV
jgi:hypothetical protein